MNTDVLPAEAEQEPLPQSTEADLYSEALTELETLVGQLAEAFRQLDVLSAEEKEFISSCDEAAREEAAVLQNEETSEKQSVDRLLRARALKDVRLARLANLRKRLSNHRDLIVFDLGAPLRKNFATVGHGVLVRKEREMRELFNRLLPPNSIGGLDNEVLVRVCAPCLKVRQGANFLDNTPYADRAQELEALRELPRRWLETLGRLIQGLDPFEPVNH